MIIDGKDLILGRLGTYAAKQVLLGEKVDVINCESVIISGHKRMVLAKYQKFRDMGVQPNKGPFQPRMPDRLVRRAIKRMLPMRRARGMAAFRNIMCHIGVPEEFKDKEYQKVEQAQASKLSTLKYITVGEICKEMGAKYLTK